MNKETKNKKQFTHLELLLALQNIADLMDRALCPYFLLEETAHDIFNKKNLSGDKIIVGINYRHAVKLVKDVAKDYANAIITDDGFSYIFKNIPIIVKFIKKDYYFFKHLNPLIYEHENYLLPNPFDKYWKARNIIQ